MNSVALVRAARNDLAQKNDLLVPFPDRDIEVHYPFSFQRQLSQFVVMSREQGPRLDRVVQKFRHAPRNRQAIEG